MSCAKCVGAAPLAGLSRRAVLNRFGMGLGGIAVANLINPAGLFASGSDGQDRGVLNGQFHVPPQERHPHQQHTVTPGICAFQRRLKQRGGAHQPEDLHRAVKLMIHQYKFGETLDD